MRSLLSGLIVFTFYSIGCLLIINTFFYEEVSTVTDSLFAGNQKESTISTDEQLLSKPQNVDNIQIKAENHPPAPKLTIKNAPVVETDPDSKNTAVEYKAKSFSVYSNESAIIISCEDYSTITKNSEVVMIPYKCINYGNQIKRILADDPTATLSIKGYRSNNEDPDLGVQRADYVKNLLTSIGINSSKVITSGTMKPIKFINNKARGGVFMELNSSKSFATETYSSSSSAIPKTEKLKKVIPYTLNDKTFTKGYKNQYFVGNQDFTKYLQSLSAYLKNYPSKKVYVTVFQKSQNNAKEDSYIYQVNSLNVKKLMTQMRIPNNKIICNQRLESLQDSLVSNQIYISVK